MSFLCKVQQCHVCSRMMLKVLAPSEQVSAGGKPLYFFVKLSERFLKEFGEVQLSAIGGAIHRAVSISQIITNSGAATELRESSC